MAWPDSDDRRWAKPNTVQLVVVDDVGGWVVGLGPVGVVGAFDVPFGHLAFDDAWCGSGSAGGVESVEQSAEDDAASDVRRRRGRQGGKSPGGRRMAGDAQGGDEADPVGVVAGVDGGVGHQRADRVVAAQVSPDLLQHQVGRLRAQHRPGAALVGLELVEGDLDLPALVVGGGQLGRGRLGRVEDGGEQPVGGRVARGRRRRCSR